MPVQHSHRRRRLAHVIVLFGAFMLAMLITTSVLYWRLMSADTKKRLNMESVKEDVASMVSTIPTLPPQLVLSRPSYNIPSSVSFKDPNIMKLPSSASVLSPSVATSLSSSVATKVDVESQKAVNPMDTSSIQQSPDQQSTSLESADSEGQIAEDSTNELRTEETTTSVAKSCDQTPLVNQLKGYSLLSISDFDCSVSNTGWEQNLPPVSSNRTRAERYWQKRLSVIKAFSEKQDDFDFDEDSKYIVFWPIFAGIGNNIAVFTEALLIALMSNRKLLGGYQVRI